MGYLGAARNLAEGRGQLRTRWTAHSRCGLNAICVSEGPETIVRALRSAMEYPDIKCGAQREYLSNKYLTVRRLDSVEQDIEGERSTGRRSGLEGRRIRAELTAFEGWRFKHACRGWLQCEFNASENGKGECDTNQSGWSKELTTPEDESEWAGGLADVAGVIMIKAENRQLVRGRKGKCEKIPSNGHTFRAQCENSSSLVARRFGGRWRKGEESQRPYATRLIEIQDEKSYYRGRAALVNDGWIDYLARGLEERARGAIAAQDPEPLLILTCDHVDPVFCGERCDEKCVEGGRHFLDVLVEVVPGNQLHGHSEGDSRQSTEFQCRKGLTRVEERDKGRVMASTTQTQAPDRQCRYVLPASRSSPGTSTRLPPDSNSHTLHEQRNYGTVVADFGTVAADSGTGSRSEAVVMD
ncbi:hypothetical protein FB451DRAFT_1188524 [Mycena latifolia]|nr:hypothetical protein FB451DRAFT_1188524 [Mycena latifolia]